MNAIGIEWLRYRGSGRFNSYFYILLRQLIESDQGNDQEDIKSPDGQGDAEKEPLKNKIFNLFTPIVTAFLSGDREVSTFIDGEKEGESEKKKKKRPKKETDKKVTRRNAKNRSGSK